MNGLLIREFYFRLTSEKADNKWAEFKVSESIALRQPSLAHFKEPSAKILGPFVLLFNHPNELNWAKVNPHAHFCCCKFVALNLV